VEWSEAWTKAAASNHDDHRALPTACTAPINCAELAKDLVESQGEKIGELDEGDRTSSSQGPTDAGAYDGGLA
jgi:hypothetical protein